MLIADGGLAASSVRGDAGGYTPENVARAESAAQSAASQYGERVWKRRRNAVQVADSGADQETGPAQAGWRTGRPPHDRVSGTDAIGEPGQDEPGWVEGWFRERLLDGAFDDRGGPDDGPGDHETSS